MLKKVAILLLSGALFLALSGCNTIHGIGKDIKKAGSAIEQAAS